MKLTSSASFSPSIRISLRLKIHQAQAKNFCRVLDIRVPEIMIPDLPHPLRLEQLRKALCDVVGLDQIANLIDTYILKIVLDVAASAQAAVFLLFFFQRKKSFPHERNKRQCPHVNGQLGYKQVLTELRSKYKKSFYAESIQNIF